VKKESAFVAALKECRSFEDVVNISDEVVKSAQDDERDYCSDAILAMYVRLIPDYVLYKTIGQVASGILKAKRSRLLAQAEI